MRNPSNLMSALRKDVNKKYRNSTKTQVDDRAMILPKMVDLNMQMVDEIKYTENGVLKTLSPTKNQVFFSVSNLSWKYTKSKEVLKNNIDNESILINEHAYKLFQTHTGFVPVEYKSSNDKPLDDLELGMEILNPFLLFFLGEMIPWSCIRMISTLNNDYLIIENNDFPRGSGFKSGPVKNILDTVKMGRSLWCGVNAIKGFECLQFYSPIIYIEAGDWAVGDDYDDSIFDKNNMKLLFSVGDKFSNLCEYRLGLNHSWNYLENAVNMYEVPTKLLDSGKNGGIFIKIYLPYSYYDTPGMYMIRRKYTTSQSSYNDYELSNNYDIKTLLHTVSMPSSFSVNKDAINFAEINPQKILLNIENTFLNESYRFGSVKLWDTVANVNYNTNNNSITGKDKNPNLKFAAGSSVGSIIKKVGGICSALDADAKKDGDTIYQLFSNYDSNEWSLIDCINAGRAYPHYDTGYAFDATTFDSYGIDVGYISQCSIYDIIFFDRHGSQNNIKNENHDIIDRIKIEEKFIYENIRTYKTSNDIVYNNLTHNNISSSTINSNSDSTDSINTRRLINTEYDTFGHNMSNDRFLAYTSLFNTGLLIDTIKEFTPIFQSTFYVSSKDHQFYKDMDSSGMSFTYRGKNGEPNYLIEFLNGKIPDDYDTYKYDANKFKFIPLTNVSANGDTYEFIHFTNVHNNIYDEVTSIKECQSLSAIYNNFVNKNQMEFEKTKVLAYPIGDSTYANRELMVDTAGYQFYFDYPYDMTKNLNVGYLLGWKKEEGGSSVVILNNNGIIRYPVEDNVFFDGTMYNVNDGIVSLVIAMFGSQFAGQAGCFALNKNGKIHTFDRISNSISKNTNKLSHIFSIKDNICTLKRIEDSDTHNLSSYFDVKGIDDIGYLSSLKYDPEDKTMYQYNIDTEDGMVYSFTKDVMERIYLSKTITDAEKEALKDASYDFVKDFYGNRKFVNYDGEITTEPITYKTYGCDFYFDPKDGYPLLELDCEMVKGSNDYKWTVEPSDINYFNHPIKIVPETQFRYAKLYIDMPRVSIDLPADFQYCREQNRYLVFLNGSLIDTANYRITSPRSDLPFTKVSLYLSISMDEGDYLEVFYLPHELYQVEYRETMINNIGDIIVDFGDQPYLMQYLTADTCMVFINGKKVPATKIKNISMNRLSIMASDITSIENLIVYSFIPFFPMVDYLAELNNLRLEMIKNPKNDNSLYQMTKMFDSALKANFSSVWDTIAFKIVNNIALGGYSYAFDSATKDANMFDGAADDIAIVYEVIRDSYVSGIVTGVPFVYTYDDVIFDQQEDIDGDDVIMSDVDGIKLINIYNAMLEHSYILDRDYQGYEAFLPSYSVETLGYDTVYIRYTESLLTQTANGLLIPGLFNVLEDNGTNRYYINTDFKGTHDGLVRGDSIWVADKENIEDITPTEPDNGDEGGEDSGDKTKS